MPTLRPLPLLIAAIFASAAHAADLPAETEDGQLEEVVVTGERTNKKRKFDKLSK